jgi:hypothetical protein
MHENHQDYTIPPSPHPPTTPTTSNFIASTTLLSTRNYDPLGIAAQEQQQAWDQQEQDQPPIWITMYDLDEFIVMNHLMPNPSLGLNEIKPTILETLLSAKYSIAPPRRHQHPYNHTNNPCLPLSQLA